MITMKKTHKKAKKEAVKKITKEAPAPKKKVQPKHIGITIGIIVILGIVFFLLNRGSSTQEKIYEATTVDVLSIPHIKASQVSIKGVKLGDTLEDVLKKLGYPDKQQIFQPDITNVEYSKKLGMEESGLILHFKGDILARMTLKAPFNQHLIGMTKVNNTKTQLFNLLGKPDIVKKVPIAPGSFLLMSLYVYENRGIELLIRKDEQNALSFVKI